MLQKNSTVNWIGFFQSMIFSAALFLSAALFFVIQPMLAKSLLPFYGGAPAVWIVCMLFFQGLLLAGYGYAWFLSWLDNKNLQKNIYYRRVWRFLHLSVLVAIACYIIIVPVYFEPVQITGYSPDQAILVNLVRQVGVFILLLASTSPLLQFIYSQTAGRYARDPYFFFVASNAGSLLALLTYPFLIERYFGLREQFYYWTCFYLIDVVLVGGLIVLSLNSTAKYDHEKVVIDATSWQRRFLWLCYGFIPCSLMLGMTFYITTDLAATPLLWILPLMVYLLSFIVAFTKKSLISREWLLRNILFFMIFPVLGFIFGVSAFPIMMQLTVHLILLGLFCLLFHSELYRLRPPVGRLTNFYCYLALGGVFAGLFNGVIAAHLFSGAYEYPLVLLLAMIMLPKHNERSSFNWTPVCIVFLLVINYFLSKQTEPMWPVFGWMKNNHALEVLGLVLLVIWPGSRINLTLSLSLLMAVALSNPKIKNGIVLTQQRNFYGVKQVIKLDDAHALLSNTTLHGFQLAGESRNTNRQLSYYYSPFTVIQQLQKFNQQLHAIVIGLGAGTIACQFRKTDAVEMIEIDAQMTKIAQNQRYFTFLSDCAPHTKLIAGDGRQAVKLIPDASRDLLIMDAFNSDAVPTHLLTQEAIQLYTQKLTADGVILVNITNRHINLLPVLVAAANRLEKIILYKFDHGKARLGQFPAAWVLLTSNELLASQMMQDGWRFVADSKALLWTDDYSNILPLLRWHA